jgi:hypothetical protein
VTAALLVAPPAGKTLFFVLESVVDTFPSAHHGLQRGAVLIPPLPSGVYTLTVYFRVMSLNDQTVTLVMSAIWLPQPARTIDDVPQAADDAFSLSLNTVLSVRLRVF